ncbi:hypothetical protein V9L05_08640 [Bernardetia sp. Wsw4-3y2]|uniref:hypothetical protein n=1 Tax=Bernardetia sp. Wsw4-3y2 TaxID=3127471 RepID=UPI0030CB6CC9
MAKKKLKLLDLPKKPTKSATPAQKLKFLEKEKEVNAENDRRIKADLARQKAEKELQAKVEKAINARKKRK